MRKPTVLDWIGATAFWGMASAVFGTFLHMGLLLQEEVGVIAGFSTFFTGIAAARLWVLRRPAVAGGQGDAVGLSTGEAQLARLEEVELRLAEMEALQERVAELEERLDFSERLLVSGGQRQPQERLDA
ncbi:MAG: hypothetical protein KJZ47_03570 [Gemmatimonadales bacterium]|nr:hypothetical protein [Gemmatimonadales bacterium]